MSYERFEVAVVGAGYVGLVTAACLAHVGHRVTVMDKDAGRIAELSRGQTPIHEPGLAELVAAGLERERLSFATELREAVREAEVLFIAVDTPPAQDGSADLSSVAAVSRSIGASLAEARRGRPLVVVNKSTVPVGSGDYVSMLVEEGAVEANRLAEYRVVSNPEFLREGCAVGDSLFPDRIVLGADRADALETMRALYAPVIEGRFEPVPEESGKPSGREVALLETDLASAEMIKYAANAFLATKISFINEVSNICELVGADVGRVAEGMGLDERIGPRFLRAGIGWGGSCFPKDVSALRSIAREHGYEPAMLDATASVNADQRRRVISKLQRELYTLRGKRVALLGLSFKPQTDDLRDAPSLEIARALSGLGARVTGYDPVAGPAAAGREPKLEVADSPYEAMDGAHAAVLVTEWDELCVLDLDLVYGLMQAPRLLLDGRNALDPGPVSAAGLLYRSFGLSEKEESFERRSLPLQHTALGNGLHAPGAAG